VANADAVGKDVVGDGRDRDGIGRPRNARPRDELGRPLPYGTVGVRPIPDDLSLPPRESIAEAQRLLTEGRSFQAHEVLEASWKAAAAPERELWRGLAQIAVGLTHARRGNATGAVRLLRRAADRLEPYAAAPPHSLDVAGLVAWTRALTVRVDGEGVQRLAPADLTPRLRQP